MIWDPTRDFNTLSLSLLCYLVITLEEPQRMGPGSPLVEVLTSPTEQAQKALMTYSLSRALSLCSSHSLMCSFNTHSSAIFSARRSVSHRSYRLMETRSCLDPLAKSPWQDPQTPLATHTAYILPDSGDESGPCESLGEAEQALGSRRVDGPRGGEKRDSQVSPVLWKLLWVHMCWPWV